MMQQMALGIILCMNTTSADTRSSVMLFIWNLKPPYSILFHHILCYSIKLVSIVLAGWVTPSIIHVPISPAPATECW